MSDVKRKDLIQHGRSTSNTVIVKVLIDALILGTVEAAARHNYHPKTIQRWMDELETDPALRKLYIANKTQLTHDFRLETAETLRACLDFIRRAAAESDPKDPRSIRAVAGAMKLAGEFRLATDITYANLGIFDEYFPKNQLGDGRDEYAMDPGDVIIDGDIEELEELE